MSWSSARIFDLDYLAGGMASVNPAMDAVVMKRPPQRSSELRVRAKRGSHGSCATGGKARYQVIVKDGIGDGHREECYEAEDQRFLREQGIGEKLVKAGKEANARKRRALEVVVLELGEAVGEGVAESRTADRLISKARTLIGYVLWSDGRAMGCAMWRGISDEARRRSGRYSGGWFNGWDPTRSCSCNFLCSAANRTENSVFHFPHSRSDDS